MPESSSSSSSAGVTPSTAQAARLQLAIIAKAARFLKLPEAPFGTVGTVTEFGVATVQPDHAIRELLFGLSYRNLDLATVEVSAETVVLATLGVDLAAQFPESKVPQVELAIDAAKGWVQEYLEGFGIA